MKKLLLQWFNRLVEPQSTTTVEESEVDFSKHIELLIPISQLYGIEFHPTVYRYYER